MSVTISAYLENKINEQRKDEAPEDAAVAGDAERVGKVMRGIAFVRPPDRAAVVALPVNFGASRIRKVHLKCPCSIMNNDDDSCGDRLPSCQFHNHNDAAHRRDDNRKRPYRFCDSRPDVRSLLTGSERGVRGAVDEAHGRRRRAADKIRRTKTQITHVITT
jgi:hypothetical protein